MKTRLKTSLFVATVILVLCIIIMFWNVSRQDNKSANSNSQQQIITNPQTNQNSILNLENIFIPIFMYHHVRDIDDPNDKTANYLAVTTEKFKNELDLLEKLGYTPVNFKEIEEGILTGQTLTNESIVNGSIAKKAPMNNKTPIKKPIILTFDDGYVDFYTNAFPELKKRNLSAVIYLITDKLNTDGYMTTDQIKEMQNFNIEIGSHTLTHANLQELSDEELKKEISDSKTFLENLTRESVLSFCYQYGKYNSRSKKIVKEAGYKYAVTTITGDAKFNNLLDLARRKVYSDTNINWYVK